MAIANPMTPLEHYKLYMPIARSLQIGELHLCSQTGKLQRLHPKSGSYAPSQIQELCTPNWSSLETGQRALNFFDLLK